MRNLTDLKKKSYFSNYGQNRLPINFDDARMLYTKSELKFKPQEKPACVLLTWTSLKNVNG